GAQRAVDQGFTGIKIKVGSSVERDLQRLAAVRRAIGPDVTLAIDGNGKWDLPTCLRFSRAAQGFDVLWFEEPLWYDDVKGHAELARAGLIPVALGEQLYTAEAFAEFFHQGALHWAQPDVTRMAGLTEVWRVCETAQSWRLPVAPHAGDMSQVHVHLAWSHPAVQVLEYIPWIQHCFTDPAEVVDGHFRLPSLPGAGTTPTPEAWERYRQAVG
ncbi:MAG: mandelate racemase/muconate lactonizing enzyme family protein, partial [Hylemonella sp.]|nr:mandelate racemase/muconate lactonizing enzyme family protein [Hylemonella sp.]